jgi:death-on-curing protein
VRGVHRTAIGIGGGLEGEYTGRLEAVCARAFQNVFGEELFPTVQLKAAALFHGIIADHAFADGNKRTASLVALTMLISSGFLHARPTNLQVRLVGEVAIEAALRGSIPVDEIADWFDRILAPRGSRQPHLV